MRRQFVSKALNRSAAISSLASTTRTVWTIGLCSGTARESHRSPLLTQDIGCDLREQSGGPHEDTELVRTGSDPTRLAESITFFYTDVRGRRWARTGSQQPRLWTPTSG